MFNKVFRGGEGGWRFSKLLNGKNWGWIFGNFCKNPGKSTPLATRLIRLYAKRTITSKGTGLNLKSYTLDLIFVILK